MYEVNDILKMLEDGKTSDEIAKSFADSLNKAIKEKEEKDTQKKAEELRQSVKRADMADIVGAVKIYMETHYPEEWKEYADMDLYDPELLDDMIAQTDKYIQLNKNVAKFMNALFPEVKEEKKAVVAKSDLPKDSFKDSFGSFEDVFSDFCKKNGIK